jgi:hypothetical protein
MKMNKKESIKVIGKRADNLNLDWMKVNDFLKLVIELNKKNKFLPKGLYKFKTNNENEKWILTILTNR